MFGASLVVLLGTWCTASSAQPVLTQESSMSTAPGQTVKLSCSMSSGAVTSYEQSWYQQKPGSPPRLLYYYYSSAAAGPGDVSRFSASKESSRNTWYLTISNIQAGDEAVYYCAVWYGSTSVFHSSNAQYTLTQPPIQSASLEQSTKLSCTMSSDSRINSYNIFWYQQKAEQAPRFVLYGTSSRGEGIPDRFTGSKDSSANVAYLTITSIQAEDEAVYYCADAYGSVSRAQPMLTQGSSMSAALGQTVKLSCSMSSGALTSYSQFWYQQKPGSPPRHLFYYFSSASAGSVDVSRFSASKESSRNTWYLTINNVQAGDEADYYCAVWYEPNKAFHSSKSQLSQPRSASVSLGGTVRLSCTLRPEDSIGGYRVSWY
ncbi:immunoglobulin alpha-2 heavy chain-like [Rhineura floridana]|uniref:immunoglobulin alpha-2 heavy chain-like n=1 Tax=Rhineura floridana TaxID=261503 RepID=UPI002AC84C68|nr:immunoglobulin alpha-2 heavy chain-like [Rhineura floridana]